MELDARKLRILKAVIDEYVLSAAPVGSRSISRRSGLNLSSATIRNEMADLEELGYLEQPHTSAGRVPSDKAYRLYVDSMMRRSRLSEDEVRLIRRYFDRRIDGVEMVIAADGAGALRGDAVHRHGAARRCWSSTGCATSSSCRSWRGARCWWWSRTRALRATRWIRVPEHMRVDELEKLSRLLTARPVTTAAWTRWPSASRARLGAELRERRAFLSQVAETIERQMTPGPRAAWSSPGATNMLHYPEYSDMAKARSFLAAVEGRGRALRHAQARQPGGVLHHHRRGRTICAPLQDCSVVTATYRIEASCRWARSA